MLPLTADEIRVVLHIVAAAVTVDLTPSGDPGAFVERVGAKMIPRLAELDPAS